MVKYFHMLVFLIQSKIYRRNNCDWYKNIRSNYSFWPAAQRATTVPRTSPLETNRLWCRHSNIAKTQGGSLGVFVLFLCFFFLTYLCIHIPCSHGSPEDSHSNTQDILTADSYGRNPCTLQTSRSCWRFLHSLHRWTAHKCQAQSRSPIVENMLCIDQAQWAARRWLP